MKNDDALKAAIDGWFDRHAQALVRDVGRLIAVKSIREDEKPGKPYGEGPAAALETGALLMRELGFTPENFENRVVTADLNAGDDEPALGILAHLDTVSVGEGWSADPFKQDRRDGNLYGRGVIDNKGPAVAALYALAAARELAPGLVKGCRLLLGSAEETGHDDLTHYRKTHKLPPAVFSPDADYPIVNLEKGRFVPAFGAEWTESRLEPQVVYIRGGETANVGPEQRGGICEGAAAGLHTGALRPIFGEKRRDCLRRQPFTMALKSRRPASPPTRWYRAEGTNAQTALLAVLAELPLREGPSASAIRALAKLFPHGDTSGEALGIAMQDEVSGPLTLNFGVLSLGPTGFTANFDCRFPKCATDETLGCLRPRQTAKSRLHCLRRYKNPMPPHAGGESLCPDAPENLRGIHR